jgi:hypothetical protein
MTKETVNFIKNQIIISFTKTEYANKILDLTGSL